jgi:hypothetical protein
MNRGRQNGKRHAKGKRTVKHAATRVELVRAATVADQLDQRTGTNTVVLDNTVPGGIRLEHTPGRTP